MDFLSFKEKKFASKLNSINNSHFDGKNKEKLQFWFGLIYFLLSSPVLLSVILSISMYLLVSSSVLSCPLMYLSLSLSLTHTHSLSLQSLLLPTSPSCLHFLNTVHTPYLCHFYFISCIYLFAYCCEN